MPDFGLIGHPIEHSQSPKLFETAYHGKYGYDLIEGQYFEESYAKFLKGYKAVNVTAPFKEKAYEKADIVSGPVALTGAANILVKTPEGVSAHNSDFTGVILTVAEALFPGIIHEFYGTFGSKAHVKIHQFVKAQLVERYGRRPAALVAGLGGAGKAAALAAAECGFATTVMNRTAAKAEAFIKGLPEYGFRVADIQDFRKELLYMRGRISAKIKSDNQASFKREDESHHAEDSTEAYERFFAIETSSSFQEIIYHIDEALNSIKEGTYGICKNCGGLIQKPRLQALPFAKNCIRCQALHERRQ